MKSLQSVGCEGEEGISGRGTLAGRKLTQFRVLGKWLGRVGQRVPVGSRREKRPERNSPGHPLSIALYIMGPISNFSFKTNILF